MVIASHDGREGTASGLLLPLAAAPRHSRVAAAASLPRSDSPRNRLPRVEERTDGLLQLRVLPAVPAHVRVPTGRGWDSDRHDDIDDRATGHSTATPH